MKLCLIINNQHLNNDLSSIRLNFKKMNLGLV